MESYAEAEYAFPGKISIQSCALRNIFNECAVIRKSSANTFMNEEKNENVYTRDLNTVNEREHAKNLPPPAGLEPASSRLPGGCVSNYATEGVNSSLHFRLYQKYSLGGQVTTTPT